MLSIQKALRDLKDEEKAKQLSRFFKTGAGQYGEGDKFLGITVPIIRKLVKEHFKDLRVEDAEALLKSPWHEERFAGLVLMTALYKKTNDLKALYDLYKKQIGKGINNWDLVDVSAHHIFGAYIFEHTKDPVAELEKLTQGNLWQRRVAIVSTFYALRKSNDVKPTMQMAEVLINDEHDLMHKAVGWLLREAGKRDLAALRKFLSKHAGTMPRTMLRYSIEKMDKAERQKWMSYG